MDYNNQNNNSTQGNSSCSQQQFFRSPGLNMASASLILGVAALFTILAVFPPLICGSLGILFALLSKGYGKKMITQAKIGLACAAGSLCLTVCMFLASFGLLLSNPDLLIEFGKQYDDACESVYGQSSEELLGYSFEDMMSDYADLLH